ncbi:hypothetical protein CHS0354_007508 [Potamilus streckersoni]|uniref:Uncharacterized protein n=1 Tax=Potamilus streckersoni TaxID=2493646 RepID=A0AAE0T852_9BIVA|nr:hypothetical protein CHS0354_007508 [Potamilus streckersoni]
MNRVERRHVSILRTIQPEYFSENNGFWLSLKPENYKRIVGPNAWELTMAIRTTAALLGWLESIKKSTMGQKEWVGVWLGRHDTANVKIKPTFNQASATFTPPCAVEKPVSVPTTPKEVNLSPPTNRCTTMKTPSVAEKAPEAL